MSYGQEASSSSSSSSSPKPPSRWHYAEFNDSNFEIRGRTLFFIVALFSVVLLLALLFLYARLWVCRFSAAPPPPSTPPPARRIPRRSGLDAAEISGLPIVLHKGKGDGSSTECCCICLGVFDQGDRVKALPRCQHFFHSQCVDKWLTAQSTCPLCRAAIMADPPV